MGKKITFERSRFLVILTIVACLSTMLFYREMRKYRYILKDKGDVEKMAWDVLNSEQCKKEVKTKEIRSMCGKFEERLDDTRSLSERALQELVTAELMVLNYYINPCGGWIMSPIFCETIWSVVKTDFVTSLLTGRGMAGSLLVVFLLSLQYVRTLFTKKDQRYDSYFGCGLQPADYRHCTIPIHEKSH